RRLKDLAPAVIDLAEDAGDHAAHLIGGRAALGVAGFAGGLIARGLASASKDFRSANQQPWIDAESVADQSEHDDGTDAEPAAAHWKTEAAAHSTSASFVVTVLDVLAAAKIIVTHGTFSSFRLAIVAARRK